MTVKRVSRSEAKAAGLRFYFTGTPCKHGHIALRYVSAGCVACVLGRDKNKLADNMRKWRASNPERNRSNGRKQYRSNIEKFRAKCRKWRQSNLDKQRALLRNWRSLNSEKIRDDHRQWRHANPDKVRGYSRKHYRKNPARYKANASNRRSRKRSIEGRFSAADISRILKQQRRRCAYYVDCGRIFSRQNFHIDHIKPLAKGGTNWPKNLQLLCPSCNLRKWTADPIDYARRQGRML